MRKLCASLAIVCLASAARAATIWIDTDVSIGSPIREVDDAYALVLAFHSREIRIAGLSTTYGNAPLAQTTRVARDFVNRFGRVASLTVDQVHAGAGAPSDLGRRSGASDALAATLQKQKITYIALGPLTNLATFLRLHPHAAKQIERVIFVGGQVPGTKLAFGPNRSFHIHDANVFKDPVATEIVLRSKIPLVLMPIATASRLLIDEADLQDLSNSGTAGIYLARRSKTWLWFWTHIAKTNGGPIFDAVAIIPVARPEVLSMSERYARMDEAGNLVVTPRLTNGARRVRYCTGFASGTKPFVMERLVTQRSR
jgi:pyrimidine-specific ribonucleoside hydrolase